MEKLNDYVWQLWDIKFLYDEDMNATEDRAVAENKDSDDDSDKCCNDILCIEITSNSLLTGYSCVFEDHSRNLESLNTAHSILVHSIQTFVSLP